MQYAASVSQVNKVLLVLFVLMFLQYSPPPLLESIPRPVPTFSPLHKPVFSLSFDLMSLFIMSPNPHPDATRLWLREHTQLHRLACACSLTLVEVFFSPMLAGWPPRPNYRSPIPFHSSTAQHRSRRPLKKASLASRAITTRVKADRQRRAMSKPWAVSPYSTVLLILFPLTVGLWQGY